MDQYPGVYGVYRLRGRSGSCNGGHDMRCYGRYRVETWHRRTPCQKPATHFLIYVGEARNLCDDCNHNTDHISYERFDSMEERDAALLEKLL